MFAVRYKQRLCRWFDLAETVDQDRADNEDTACQRHGTNGFTADDGGQNRIEDWFDA